ncbi:MAG: M48 family metallopeptidase [Gammaproteobacteria bacterium]|nr:M48 family metallopeptidase [Gammaproteobacteria bacterium]NNC66800.1 M48 family metallopeptidase [Gammaproteobacteria bacterium]
MMRRSAYRYGRGGNRRGGALRLLPIVLFGLYLAYYYFSNQEEVAMTGRSQLIDISHEQEMALGLQSYQQILSQQNVLRSGQVVDLVREIGYRLAKVIDDDPGFEWEFNVIDDGQANAFALPGGKVAVYTGILPIVENVNGLSAVMGHEIAHAIARHGAERMAHQKLVQYGSMAAGMALGSMDIGTQRMVMGALGMGAQYGVLLPFSRKHESEADYMGLIYLARACFDPLEAPKIWERMSEHSKGQPSEFMSTHPSHETRIRLLNEWMPKALEIREKFCSS